MTNILDRKVMDRADKLYLLLFFVSYLSPIFCTVFFLLLFLYSSRGVEKGIKSLILITTRGIMSRAVATDIGFPMVKLAALLGISLMILFSSPCSGVNRRRLKRIMFPLGMYVVYVFIISFVNSSYPTTSVFKLFSFWLPFAAILAGVAKTNTTCRWEDYLSSLYAMLMLISFCTIPFGRFRITNGAFQGIFNHVNMFGIVAALFLAAFLSSSLFEKNDTIRYSVIGATLLMIFLSASRTGMFTAIAVLGIYCIVGERKEKRGLLLLLTLSFLILIVLALMDSDILDRISSVVTGFVVKESKGTILESRLLQIWTVFQKIERNIWIGSGFMVPISYFDPDYALYFNLMVEPGNIIMSVLGDTGIIGLVLFLLFLMVVFSVGNKRKLYLLVAALMINMGEMVFFSSNNMSILCYMLIAMYVFRTEDTYQRWNSEGIA